MFAEARFRTPWVDDEFATAISAAGQWLRDNPSPDGRLSEQFTAMLGAYAEMTNATVSRVMDLRLEIAQHVEALNGWDIQIVASAESSRAGRGSRVPPERRATVGVPVEGNSLESSAKKSLAKKRSA
jgi:hypothetical protein